MSWTMWNVAVAMPNMFSDNDPWVKASLLQ